MSETAAEANGDDPGLVCEPGVERLFGLEDIANSGLRQGWASPEDGHNWNDGVTATLLLSTPGEIGPGSLIVTGQPYLSTAQPLQEITTYVNGHWAGFSRVSRGGLHRLPFEIEPEWWFRRNRVLVAKVNFHIPYSIRPMDIGVGHDLRELGFCFLSLLLLQHSQPVPGTG